MVDRKFVEELASKEPTPGGGGASAYAGALSSALSSMVANLTVGKKKYAEVEAEMFASLERLAEIRERLLALVDEDAQAFLPLAKAYGLPRETPGQRAFQAAALQAGLKDACEVPLKIMRACAEVIRETEFLAWRGSRLALSDAGVAALFAKAALQGASLNIFINTGSMDDADLAQSYRQEAQGLIDIAGSDADKIVAYVMQELG